jgi:sigma-B regulation protein RsbU (phosphoserine phosphatase)
MAKTTLTISGPDKTWQVELNPQGTVIGRSPRRDILLESRQVSRRHARFLQDPFGRWIVEDLGSSNGTFIGGKRIEACPVLPGDRVIIGPFCLSITHSLDQQIAPDESVQATNVVVEDFETEIFYGKSKADESSLRPRPRQLTEITELLSELTSPAALYPEVCRYLARAPKTVALVLRLPERAQPLPKSPQILACSFGDSPDDTKALDRPGLYPSLPVILNQVAYRVSRHVLEEVRSKGNAVMAKSIYSSDEEITVTMVDEHSPRALICAPLGDVARGCDALYLDVPIDEAARTTPEEVFELVRAISREIVSTRKTLILMQAKAERSGLNHELSLARQIQLKLTPTVPPGLSGVDVALYYKPTMWVGGDYCDIWLLKDGRLAFAVGHVSDKGLAAAMVMSHLRTALRITMSFCTELSDVAKKVNSHLLQSLPKGVSVTLFLGLFDPSDGTLQHVNAGHAQPLMVQPQSTIVPLSQTDNSALGIADAAFRTSTRTIPKRAQFITFTNGITKAKSPDGQEFGVKRLVHLLESAGVRSADGILNSIIEAVTDFRQTLGPHDDVTALVLVNQE